MTNDQSLMPNDQSPITNHQSLITTSLLMTDNQTIARNSLILYIRLIITTIIGLYSSRIVLLELGAEGFGLFAVVGGIVAMLNMLNITMITTSNRYIATEIGKKDGYELNKVFNSLLVVHLFFGLILFAFVEVVGVWYVQNHLNIEAGRLPDALFILRLSAISAIVSTVIVPYQGLITAHESFFIRATIEVLQSLLALCAVILLTFHAGNKLQAYAIYILMVQIIVAALYFIYCKLKHSKAIRLKINKQSADYIGISKFFGWQLVSVAGSIGVTQGGAIIINLFFGTVLNAAYGIAFRVSDLAFAFVQNLNQAALPQIMKSYSGGNQQRTIDIVYKLTKYTYFIMLIPAVPILLSIDAILLIWLKEVPPFTAAFVVFRIVHGLISSLQSGFDMTINASGNIRKTKVFFSILFLSMLPLVYLLYSLNFPPYTLTIVLICAEVVFLLFQTRVLSGISEFTFLEYFSKTLLPVFFVTSLIIPQFFVRQLLGDNLVSLLWISFLSVILNTTIIYFAGLDKKEKNVINSYLNKLPLIRTVLG